MSQDNDPSACRAAEIRAAKLVISMQKPVMLANGYGMKEENGPINGGRVHLH